MDFGIFLLLLYPVSFLLVYCGVSAKPLYGQNVRLPSIDIVSNKEAVPKGTVHTHLNAY